jgi:hypothetical protein
VSGEKTQREVRLGTYIAAGFLVGAGRSKSDLNATARETKLVPTLKHARAMQHPVRRSVFDSDVKGTIGSMELTLIVPLFIASLQIPEVDRFPIGVITRIKDGVGRVLYVSDNG